MNETKSALVVDDERDIRELLVLTLGRMGLRISTAANLAEARELLASNPYDLCLTDMRLPDGNGIELVAMNFGFPPPRPRAGPVFNFRSENRRFANSNRCLIPASAFFEFTGNKYPKAKHRFTLKDAAFMAIAGIWREGKGNEAPAFTMLTTSPAPDVELFHDRQVVVLRPTDWAHWIYLTRPEKDLLRPLPEGSLQVETVRPGKDEAGAI